MATFCCFHRTWWIANPSWPNGREPGAGERHYFKDATGLTEQEAKEFCKEWNDEHEPGLLSDKCEYEEE